MKPNYVATKSAWAVWNFLSILLCFLILPIIVQICRTIAVKKYEIRFYDDRIIVKRGWLNTKTQQLVFMGVTAVSVEQSFWGKMCDYGNVYVDCVGKWDVDTTYIKDPNRLSAYLQTRVAHMSEATSVVHM